ncbi:threonyl-tRNA ligase [Natrinema pellirubrum DSM 15624]|uniref:Threonine--tRNA ligase n=1 Tax=Natrinema pellirubrum (strain DSM 15624 / CIP 106293 / JCM 10476 / NCIMB 786 / 157) TaxID=797303 RepID=L0JK24_NATP1|nr:threonine--tRNA ligase [Natrinema pellirubrum]AGB30706.1 threonyl-tRNA synthetase [Natrinema pellirubrum DSM 15624]ELY80370.1 threonyl-tRNA ligase [Natrinema pellirubrum DSM 15624]
MSESDSQSQERITVVLPDGSELEVDADATVEDCAYEIGPGLGSDTVAGKLDGDLVAKEEPAYDGAELEIITDGSEEYLEVMRHSAAHCLAQAVERLYDEDTVKLAIGPPTDEGFYYDFDDLDVDEEDLAGLEAEIEAIIDEDYDIEREVVSIDEAEQRLAGEPYKLELLSEFADENDTVTFYKQGEWEDLCAGPHVDSTGEIGVVELLEIAGAYWRGDEDNTMQTRIYGTAFEDESDLEDFLERKREAEKRDHRRIGNEMDLFSIQDVTGPGLPLYHPAGKTVLSELEAFVKDLNEDAGYDYVETPHVFKTDLWHRSGHYENYQDDMFIFDVGDDEFGLKPMNCPGHAAIFQDHSWSYRDLPIRYAENGKVYRKEQRGELSGLSRVWAFTIDDGHLFIRPDQIRQEVEEIMDMITDVLETFDLDYEMALATRPEKSVGSDEIWDRAEEQLENVLENRAHDYEIEEGDGAFYGPKIDFAFEDAIGRSWDGPTVQLDFNMPERFDLNYVGEDNEEHRPVMIHRALYGSYERFFMMLIEHYEGRFPLWLAPEQVRVLPISDDNLGYAHRVANEFDDFRVEVDGRDSTLERKIRAAHDDRVPYQIIVGDNEEEDGNISVRDRFEDQEYDVEIEEFRDHLEAERDEQRTEPDFLQ